MKRITLVVVLLTPLLVPMEGLASANPLPRPVLFALEGTLRQDSVHTYTVAATPEVAPADVTILVPIPQSGGSLGHHQLIVSCELSASPGTWTRAEDTDSTGNQWLSASWSKVGGLVEFVRRVQWLDEMEYGPILTSSRYPLHPLQLPADVRPWLETDSWLVQADAPAIRLQASELAAGAVMEIEVVARVLGWLHEKMTLPTCSTPVLDIDALWTLQNLTGNCNNFANLTVALLRAAGIPARPAVGFVADATADGGVAHVWVEVYFPDLGWVEFESSPWVPAGDLLVLEMGNNHFPETGVPATFLLPQHLTLERGTERGVSNAPFDERHAVQVTELERPSEVSAVRGDVAPGEAISWVVTLRSPTYYEVLEYVTGYGYSDFPVTLSLEGAPAGWYASLSRTEVLIEKLGEGSVGPNRSILLTIVPPADAPDGTQTRVTLTARSGGAVVGTLTAEVTVTRP